MKKARVNFFRRFLYTSWLIASASSFVYAAPYPATSSSYVVSSEPGKFLSGLGFALNSKGTDWIQSKGPRSIPNILTVYKNPESKGQMQAALTVRVDKLKTESHLKSYVKGWMKDYHRFGFDVLSAKPVKVYDNTAFLLDLVQAQSQKQLRQVVFLKDQTAVILTCRDHQDTFSTTLKACNEIIRSFKWTQ